MTSARAESPTIRLATLMLGALAGICASGIVLLAATSRLAAAPEALTALAGLGGAAAGALGTLLTTLTPAPLPGGRRTTDQIPAIADAETMPATGSSIPRVAS